VVLFVSCPQANSPITKGCRRTSPLSRSFAKRGTPVLLLDQFDPAVLGPALLGIVGRNGGKLAAAVRSQAARGDGVIADERLQDGLGPFLGELDIVVHATHVVRVAHHLDLEARVGCQELGDLTYGLGRLGLGREDDLYSLINRGGIITFCSAGRDS